MRATTVPLPDVTASLLNNVKQLRFDVITYSNGNFVLECA
jgi:hypothetical protein